MKLLQQGNPIAYYMPIFGSLVQVLNSSQVRPGARGHKCFRVYKYGSFPKLGLPFWGPYNRDYSILGLILGSSYVGKLPYRV